MAKRLLGLLFVLTLGLALAGCGGADPTPTPTVVPPTSTPAATWTPRPTSTPRPTNTPIATATPVATATPLDTPTATTIPIPPTATVPTYELMGQRGYSNSYSDIVVGVVKYNGPGPILPDIAIDLEDGNGNVIASEKAYTKPSIVNSGTLIPYKASFSKVSDYKRFQSHINVEPVSDFMVGVYSSEFVVTQSRLVAGDRFSNGPKVAGKVRYTGTTSANLVQVIGALWDKEGKLLDVASGITTISNLRPGQESGFEVQFDTGKGVGDHVDLVVSGFAK